MPMSMNNDKVYPDESQAIATIHAALDAGVTLIDTADIYAPSWDTMGHNEILVGKAMARLRRQPGRRGDRHQGRHHPERGREVGPGRRRCPTSGRAVEKSLRNLGVDVIDLYQWHRPDRSHGLRRGDRQLQDPAGRGQDQGHRDLQRQRRGDPGRRSTCSARTGWSACRTSSRRSSGAARTSWSTAASAGSRSCPGARWAAPAAAPARSATGSPSSPRSPPSTGSARSRWCWPGSCRWASTSSRSPGRGGRSRSPTRPRRRDLVLSDEELARCSASGGSR